MASTLFRILFSAAILSNFVCGAPEGSHGAYCHKKPSNLSNSPSAHNGHNDNMSAGASAVKTSRPHGGYEQGTSTSAPYGIHAYPSASESSSNGWPQHSTRICTHTNVSYTLTTATSLYTETPVLVTIVSVVPATIVETTTITEQQATFTSYSTIYETTGVPSTTVETSLTMFTESVTTDNPAGTYTVPPPPGFTPAVSGGLNKRADNSSEEIDPHRYKETLRAQDIPRCRSTTQVTLTSIKTTTSIKSITPEPITSTSLTTTTATSISTVLETPAETTTVISTTVTRTTTDLYTSTTVIPTTTTIFVEAARPTYYAACADNNIRIGYSVASTDLTFRGLPGDTDTPYDCCVACLLTEGCKGTAMIPSIGYYQGIGSAGDGYPCDGSKIYGVANQNTGGGIWVSNSGCGRWTFDGEPYPGL